ncbi:MAG: 23S rRNA (guanosine(2251)-2'-O)-methyltransferase RlmB [Parvularculaceae bacterium]|jgi:23S rRNA (guanosine2251-2'-O)-methyltransferase|nr:23S rRNA (guanosine(2251)-2'-O)-methyltransferase RlmB [Parvularculaceae bacterium]
MKHGKRPPRAGRPGSGVPRPRRFKKGDRDRFGADKTSRLHERGERVSATADGEGGAGARRGRDGAHFEKTPRTGRRDEHAKAGAGALQYRGFGGGPARKGRRFEPVDAPPSERRGTDSRRDFRKGRRPDRRADADIAPHSDFRSEHGRPGGGRDEDPRAQRRGERTGALWIYGRHAALAALRNDARKIRRVLAAESALEWLNEADLPPDRRALIVRTAPFEIDRALHDGAVHQGLAVEVEALPRARLRETCAPDGRNRPVVVFDQITDPHNIGAVLRSAAAFGACAVIFQDRRTPPLAGALAKAAAGAVETVPAIEVVNIARALEGLKDLGYFCAGLDGAATMTIAEIPRDKPVALVLGAEGAGLRRLVGETCDGLFRIPLDSAMESLNVSNAAAVALYEITRSPP